jgi:hypothetical protein
MVDHLSRILLKLSDPIAIHDSFTDEQLFEMTKEPPWYTYIVNYLAIGKTLSQWSKKDQNRFFK